MYWTSIYILEDDEKNEVELNIISTFKDIIVY